MESDSVLGRNLIEWGVAVVGAVTLLAFKTAKPLIDQFRNRPTFEVGSIRNNAMVDIAINTSVARLQEAVHATRAGLCEVGNGKVDATRFHELKFTCAYGYCAKGVSSIKNTYQAASFRDYPALILSLTGESRITSLCSKTVEHETRLWQEMMSAGIACSILCRIHVSDKNKLTHFLIATFDNCSEMCRVDNVDIIKRITEAADEIAVELRRRTK